MLGTDDIPPPMDVPWQMWSQSSNPYEQGLIQFEFTPKGLAVSWWGECPSEQVSGGIRQAPYVIEWHELANIASLPPKLEEDIQWIKEKAEIEGYKLGMKKAQAEFDERTKSPQPLKILKDRPDPPSAA
jgi:hypothetical protein